MRIMLITSPGGHFGHLLALRSWWIENHRTWVTARQPEVESALQDEEVTWAHFPTTRNLPNALRNFCMAWPTIRRTKPDVLVSAGAGISVPFFVVAKILRIHTVYIECFDRINMPTLSGRLCYPLADLFCVQWEEQKKYYPDAVMIGALL